MEEQNMKLSSPCGDKLQSAGLVRVYARVEVILAVLHPAQSGTGLVRVYARVEVIVPLRG